MGQIQREGLTRQSRHHVHLCADVDTATIVGRRHGVPIVLIVDAGPMHREGHSFFLSANNVWLVEAVPLGYLRFPA
jgi:putative RNA 2'-phosphotransferase